MKAMHSEFEEWRKDGWNHDPVLLSDIMTQYVEMHDGTGGLDMEMIDDILTIASLDDQIQLESLRSELQKQKELNKEAIALLDNIKDDMKEEDWNTWWIKQIESLIQKSKEL